MKNVILFVLAINLYASALGQSKEPKLLIVGIDGFRPDALKAANTPNFDSLLANGTYSYDGLIETPTLSGAGWSSILTGVWKVKHRVTNNLFSNSNFDQYPHFFSRLEESDTSLHTASFSYWSDINSKIALMADYIFSFPEDNIVTQEVVNYLTNNDPDAVFVHLGNIDHEGHIYGFADSIPEYLLEAEQNDSLMGEMILAINNRPNIANENWLIIVTTDHGGIGFVHSGPSQDERNVFMIMSGDSVINTEVKRDTSSVKVKTALSFDGTTNYAKATNAGAFNFGSNQNFTVECRVKTSGFLGDPVIVGNKNWNFESSKGFAIATAFPNGPEWVVNIGDGFNYVTIKGNPIDDGEWHHLSVTFDRQGSVNLYEDGTNVNSIFINQINDINSFLDLAIGQDGTLNYPYFFDGLITEVRIWNVLLDEQTISDYACGPVDASHPRFSNLISYWKMDEGFGSILNDAGPSGNGAEFFGSPISWTIDNNYLKCSDYTQTPRAVDVAISAIDHFCIPINPSWELDGRSWVNNNCNLPVCDPVAQIASSNVTSSSVTLNWAPNPAADHYVLRGNVIGVPSNIYLTIPNGAPPALNLSNLANNATFHWQVQAVCDAEGQSFSEYSDRDTFTTFSCLPPAVIFADSITGSTAELNWTPVPSAEGYQIVGKPVGFSNFVSLYIAGGNINSFDVSGLFPGVLYHWAVRTHCGGAYYSQYTTLDTFLTLPAKAGTFEPGNDPDALAHEVGIYPNPFSESTTVTFDNDERFPHELVLSNVNGEVVRRVAGISGNRYTLMRNELAKGVYFLELRGKKTWKGKIVIE